MSRKRLIWLLVIVALVAASVPVYRWWTVPTLPEGFHGWAKHCQRDGDGAIGSFHTGSPSGKYFAGTELDSVVLWHDGEKSQVGKPSNAKGDTFVSAMNDSGTMVGHKGETYGEAVTEGVAHLWRYADGEFSVLTLGDFGSEELSMVGVSAINGNGDAIGFAYVNEVGHIALRWRAGETEAEEIFPGQTVIPLAIGEDGAIAGVESKVPRKGLYWRPDSQDPVELPEVPGMIDINVPHTNPVSIAGDWVMLGNLVWNSRTESEPRRIDLDQYGGIDDQGRVFGVTNDLDMQQEPPSDSDVGRYEHPRFPVRVTDDRIEALQFSTSEVRQGAASNYEIRAVSQDGETILGGWPSGSTQVWNCE